MTCLEPYLKGSTDKDEQEIAYLVVAIFRTLLALTQLIFPTEFLSRTMTTIATGMTSVSLKVVVTPFQADFSTSKRVSPPSVT